MRVKNYVGLALLAGVSGCASLPTSGPTGSQIRKSALDPDTRQPIQIVNLDTSADVPAATMPPKNLPAELPPPLTDIVGPGDILDVSIYEVGVALFSGGSAAAAEKGVPVSVNPGVQVQKLPPIRIDDQGTIFIPYAGKLHVAGLTIGQIQDRIGNALRRISQNPQVIVTLNQAITNSVIVSGEVARPGRLVLQTNHETLSDVVALAGGYRGNARDLTLRIVRHDRNVDVRFADLIEQPSLDVRAYPGDRLLLINNPRTYSVLGASGRTEQLPFSHSKVSLAEAIATAGGTNPGMGDPAAVFVFRYVPNGGGKDIPVVYHLNMMKTGAYFVSQRFTMQDGDVLYFGNASANQPSKLIQLISQLFSPILTVTSAVQTVQNSSRN